MRGFDSIRAIVAPARDRNFLTYLYSSGTQYFALTTVGLFILLFFHERLGISSGRLVLLSALTPLGGYPKSGEDEARQLFQKLDQAKTREDMVAGAEFLKTRPECTGRIGAVGFCWGGGTVNMLATRVPDLGAAVPFYGSPAPAADVPKIKAPLQIHYAGAYTRINAAWPDYEAALKAAGVKYQMFMYEGAQHGFNNDTTPRYDEKSAKLAWTRTLEFFNKYLRA